MDYKKEIINFCNSLSLTEIGFCNSETFIDLKELLIDRKNKNFQNEFEEKDLEKRINPKILMPEGQTIISIAFPYFYKKYDAEVYFSIYTRGIDYHKVLSNYLKKICDFIEALGGTAKFFVDSNPLPERYIASKCGIGFIGKNNMLINKKYGSYVFLGEIITDLQIEKDTPLQNGCKNCEECLKACPTKSLGSKNSNICLSYITQKKHIEDFWFTNLKGRIFGCDSCQNVCPYNSNAKESFIDEFQPFNYMSEVDIKELLNMDNKIFTEKYKITSSGWRGKNILQRNALIYYFYKGEIDGLHIQNFKSPYIEDYYNRLLKFYKL